jgi:hypothetical protein
MKAGTLTSDPVYTLGVASTLSGIPTHSIRQYIDKGLIIPFRTKTNRQLFSDIDIHRLEIIKKYIDQGLNIAGLKALYAQIPSYLIKYCPDENCNICKKLQSTSLPCWITNANKMDCEDGDCRNCAVYKMADPVDDLKDYFLTLKRN